MRKDSNNKRPGSDKFKKEGGSSRSGGDRKPYKREDSDRPKRRNDDDNERPKRSFGDTRPGKGEGGDHPKRQFDNDRPKRSFDGDKPKRPYGTRDTGDDNRSKRPYGTRSEGGDDRPKRSFDTDRPKRSYDDKPKRSFGKREEGNEDRPKRSFEDKPKRSFGKRDEGNEDRPKRSFDSDRPKRSFDDKPKRSFGKREEGNEDRPKRSFEDKPKRSFGKRDEGKEDRPKRAFNSDRPKRSFDSDKPKRSFDDKSKRGTDKKGDKDSDKPKRGFSMDRVFDGEKPKRDFNIERPDKPQPFTKELESDWDKKPEKGKVRHKSFDRTVGNIRTTKGTDMDAYVEKKLQKADKPKKERTEDEGAEELMPLNKYISHSGECSRREAAELVKMGKVKVNGELVTDPGHKVTKEDKVTVAGKKMTLQHDHVYILLNKPKGFITTTDDPEGRRTVMELVESAEVERLFPVGRLDRNTTGLLLMTNDGALAQKLSHPSHSIKKVYQVTLDKPITKADFDKVVEGVELEDGVAHVDALAYLEKKNELGLEIHIGRNRIVRRIFESLGYAVEKLDRVMYAGLTKKNLPRSKWRFLNEKEIILLKHFKN